MRWFSNFLDVTSEFLAHRKGLLPLIGIVFIILNLILQFIPGLGWIATSNLLLHIGLLFAIFGLMLAWAL
jgi:hypothetical protein